MEHIMEQYGKVILIIIAFLAIGAIVVAMLKSDGYAAQEFQKAFTGFFNSMKALG